MNGSLVAIACLLPILGCATVKKNERTEMRQPVDDALSQEALDKSDPSSLHAGLELVPYAIKGVAGVQVAAKPDKNAQYLQFEACSAADPGRCVKGRLTGLQPETYFDFPVGKNIVTYASCFIAAPGQAADTCGPTQTLEFDQADSKDKASLKLLIAHQNVTQQIKDKALDIQSAAKTFQQSQAGSPPPTDDDENLTANLAELNPLVTGDILDDDETAADLKEQIGAKQAETKSASLALANGGDAIKTTGIWILTLGSIGVVLTLAAAGAAQVATTQTGGRIGIGGKVVFQGGDIDAFKAFTRQVLGPVFNVSSTATRAASEVDRLAAAVGRKMPILRRPAAAVARNVGAGAQAVAHGTFKYAEVRNRALKSALAFSAVAILGVAITTIGAATNLTDNNPQTILVNQLNQIDADLATLRAQRSAIRTQLATRLGD